MALSLNFHKTFIPERSYINAILKFASEDKSGDYQKISYETGIPMGKSTGKVPAILDYAVGMGLIELRNEPNNSIKRPKLTNFGRIVFLEDPYLGESLTQWLAHMNLCRPDIGAKAWHELFGKGKSKLGSSFTTVQLETYLQRTFGPGNNRTGPLLRMYLDDASFKRAKVLIQEESKIIRKPAPITPAYVLAYTAYLLLLFETFFQNEFQITIDDLNQKTLWFDICCWGNTEITHIFDSIAGTGYLEVDRQMHPWILERKYKSSAVWHRVYKELV